MSLVKLVEQTLSESQEEAVTNLIRSLNTDEIESIVENFSDDDLAELSEGAFMRFARSVGGFTGDAFKNIATLGIRKMVGKGNDSKLRAAMKNAKELSIEYPAKMRKKMEKMEIHYSEKIKNAESRESVANYKKEWREWQTKMENRLKDKMEELNGRIAHLAGRIGTTY